MPLVDLAIAPSAEEDFKATVGYGLHKSHPPAVGFSGLADDPVMFPETDRGYVMDRIVKIRKEAKNKRFLEILNGLIKAQNWSEAKELILYYFQHPEFKLPEPRFVAMIGNGWATSFVPAMSTGRYGSMAKRRAFSGLSDIAELGCGGDCGCKKCQDNIYASTGYPGYGSPGINGLGAETKYVGPGWGDGLEFTATAAPAPTGNKAVDTFNSIWGTITGTLAPLAQARANRPPREKVVVQREPDMTPAVIVGGIIVASVLAIAVARSR